MGTQLKKDRLRGGKLSDCSGNYVKCIDDSHIHVVRGDCRMDFACCVPWLENQFGYLFGNVGQQLGDDSKLETRAALKKGRSSPKY
jgi:DNA relaxase NicK